MANVFEIISRCCIMMTCLVKIDLVIGVFFEELLSSASSQHYQDGTATMIRKYLHRCDMSSDCNFLLLDTTKDQFTMVKSESEMPVNRISLRIWKKLQIIEIDGCSSNPCKNGGFCNTFAAGYSCTCAYGFEGDNCETDINECDSSPCLNGGTCTDLVDDYSCSCTGGYSGTQCEQPTVIWDSDCSYDDHKANSKKLPDVCLSECKVMTDEIKGPAVAATVDNCLSPPCFCRCSFSSLKKVLPGWNCTLFG